MITRALAIVAAAGVLASGHMVLRDAPIRLTRQGAQPAGVPTDTTPTQDSTGADPATDPATDPTTDPVTDPGTPEAGADDPYSLYASDPLFDEPVRDGQITMREAYALFEQGATFLDARHEDEFEAGHVAGAIWMPASRLSDGTGIPDAYAIDASMPVVIYCTGGDCDASENTAVLLEALELGFEIYILGRGFDEWDAVGLPTEGGS
ncbi:MAG: rhodanese-like domain-containing protein [Phycisphaerales bacterium JB040]